MAVTAPWTAWLAYRGLAHCGLTDRDRSRPARVPAAKRWLGSGRAGVGAGGGDGLLVGAGLGGCGAGACGPAGHAAGPFAGRRCRGRGDSGRGAAGSRPNRFAAGEVAMELLGRAAAVPDCAGSAVVLLALSAAVAVLLAPLASSSPDGLETVAARLGFLHARGRRLCGPAARLCSAGHRLGSAGRGVGRADWRGGGVGNRLSGWPDGRGSAENRVRLAACASPPPDRTGPWGTGRFTNADLLSHPFHFQE